MLIVQCGDSQGEEEPIYLVLINKPFAKETPINSEYPMILVKLSKLFQRPLDKEE